MERLFAGCKANEADSKYVDVEEFIWETWESLVNQRMAPELDLPEWMEPIIALLHLLYDYALHRSRVGKRTRYMLAELSVLEEVREISYLAGPRDSRWQKAVKIVRDPDAAKILSFIGEVIAYYFACYEYEGAEQSERDAIDLMIGTLRDSANPVDRVEKASPDLPLPVSVKRGLDRRVFGQEAAKEALAMSVAAFLKSGARHTILFHGPTGCGKTWLMETLEELPELKEVPIVLYTATELTKNGFSGDDVRTMVKKVFDRIQKNKENWDVDEAKDAKAIVYLDEIDKLMGYKNHDSGGADVNEAVLHDLLTAISGNGTNYCMDTRNILFLFGGAFENLDENIGTKSSTIGFLSSEIADRSESLREKLKGIGCSHQFLGRIHTMVEMEAPDHRIMEQILTNPETGILVRKRQEMMLYGIKLSWTEELIYELAEAAIHSGRGARGVEAAVEELVRPYAYQAVERGVQSMELHAGMLNEEGPRFNTRKGMEMEGKVDEYESKRVS